MNASRLSSMPTGGDATFTGRGPRMKRIETPFPLAGGEGTGDQAPRMMALPEVPREEGIGSGKQSKVWPPAMVPIPIGRLEGGVSPESVEVMGGIESSPEKRQEPVRAEIPNPFRAAPDYDDKDLKEALSPMFEKIVKEAVYKSGSGDIGSALEPMLRATIRRALAEYSPGSRPFRSPGFMDRMGWRAQALFSSRSYEEILFDKTNRFQVEEVFLLDGGSLAMISFASCDPGRHSSSARVSGAAQRIAMQVKDHASEDRRFYEKPDGRHVILERGRFTVLAAVVRGRPNDMAMADLSFVLRRIEEHFEERFTKTGSALMRTLQPFLEDCLLIQAAAVDPT